MSDDAVSELAALLDSAGARVTFDSGRNCTHPCTFCGEKPPGWGHKLLTIGHYIDGSELTRPVCAGCERVARVRMTKKEDPNA